LTKLFQLTKKKHWYTSWCQPATVCIITVVAYWSINTELQAQILKNITYAWLKMTFYLVFTLWKN